MDTHSWKTKRFAYVITLTNDWYNVETNQPSLKMFENMELIAPWTSISLLVRPFPILLQIRILLHLLPPRLGTWVLDFGIPGILVFMLALGFVIGMAYHAMRETGSALATAIYSLLIAYILVGIETGLADFNVAAFFIGSFLILYNSRMEL